MVETLMAGGVLAGSFAAAYIFQRAVLEIWFRALSPRQEKRA
jgi:hypothetical protein